MHCVISSAVVLLRVDCGGYESFNSVSRYVNIRTLTHSVCTVCTQNILTTHPGLKTYPHPHKQTHMDRLHARNNTPDTVENILHSLLLKQTLCNCLFFVLISHPSTYPHSSFLLGVFTSPVEVCGWCCYVGSAG